MAIGFAGILSILFNVTVTVFGSALVLLVMWHEPSRRSNQFLALAMLILAAHGVAGTLWQVAQQYDLKPEPLLYSSTTLYLVGVALLFNFMIRFSGAPPHRRRVRYAVGMALSAVLVTLVWSGTAYDNLEPLSTGSYKYTMTPVGKVGAGLLIGYLLVLLLHLYRMSVPRARALMPPLAILIAGLAALVLAPGLRPYSPNTAAVIVTIFITSRLILRFQVFQPLADLNAELARKNAELYTATRLKSQFLANMTHELRTPLNSILGYADMVVAGNYGSLTALQKDRLQKVSHNGRQLLDLISDVLDLSKIEAGRLVLSRARVSINDTLDALLSEYGPQATAKGLTLIRGYSALPPVWGDDERVRQILSNLLSNAVKFTEQGAVIVRGYHAPAHCQVILSVADTGIGIDNSDHLKVFEAFQQSDESLARRYEGTGLGLALTKRLVEMHDGAVWFESIPGRGSTFHVALPAIPDTPPPPPIIEPSPEASGPVVLVIAANRTTIGEVRAGLGVIECRVYGAESVNEGLQLAHSQFPALIVIETQCYLNTNVLLIEALLRSPDTSHIPLVCLESAGAPVPDAHRAECFAVLSHPLDFRQLQAAAHRALAALPAGQEVAV